MVTKNLNKAIGVFDSGLGGLTVVKELMRQMPHEDIVYYGDTARVPYGTKSKDSIIRFSVENCRALLKYNVKMIVVACNSSSSYAITTLKKKFSLPIIGVIEPGAKKAARLTINKKVGVIATTATINSGQYPRIVKKWNRSARVHSQACPLFVPLVEEGWAKSLVSLKIAELYLEKIKDAGVDTLILGCTHYPLLKGVLAKAMGERVTLIDSAKEVAASVKQNLEQSNNARTDKRKAKVRFLVTDKPQEFRKIAKGFLGREVNARKQ